MMPLFNRLADGPMMPAPERRGGLKAWRSWLPKVVILALVTVLILAHRPLLVAFAYLFRANDPAPSDALLLLTISSDDTLKLFRRGWATQILMVPGEPIPFPDLNAFEVDRQILIRMGIPWASVRVLPPVSLGADYRQIALRVREDLQRHPMRRITIAVAACQSARAGRIFRKVLGDTGVDVRIAALADPSFNESNWYQSDEGLTAYFSESIEVISEPFFSR